MRLRIAIVRRSLVSAGAAPDRDAPDVDVDDELTLEQKAAYLRWPPLASYWSGDPNWGFRTIAEHWDRSDRLLGYFFRARHRHHVQLNRPGIR